MDKKAIIDKLNTMPNYLKAVSLLKNTGYSYSDLNGRSLDLTDALLNYYDNSNKRWPNDMYGDGDNVDAMCTYVINMYIGYIAGLTAAKKQEDIYSEIVEKIFGSDDYFVCVEFFEDVEENDHPIIVYTCELPEHTRQVWFDIQIMADSCKTLMYPQQMQCLITGTDLDLVDDIDDSALESLLDTVKIVSKVLETYINND